MLQSQVRKLSRILLERGKLEGREEGRQEGLEKGREKGQRELLLRMIEVKFGEVDSRTRSRIRAAGHRRLLEWAERLVTAERLSDIFAL